MPSGCWYVKKVVVTITQGGACIANGIADRELTTFVSEDLAKEASDCNSDAPEEPEARNRQPVATKGRASKGKKK